MGYDLYITRAKSWLAKEGSPIPKTEWDKLVEADPELELSTEDFYDRKVNRKTERFHPVIWTKHRDRVPLWFIDGAVETKNPDEATVKKMVQIAKKLKARVIGEENEEYGPDGKQRPSA